MNIYVYKQIIIFFKYNIFPFSRIRYDARGSFMIFLEISVFILIHISEKKNEKFKEDGNEVDSGRVNIS